jgi:two-component system CheB/CheR fusion protein
MTQHQFESLLDFLKRNRGFDFTGYKQASLMRRIHRRMQAVGIDNFQDYIDYLEVHPDEFTFLFNTILINITGFFRDPESWEALKTEVIPELLSKNPATEPLRVWCAGNASGEEAYTIVIVLTEIMGEAAVQERVKVYATDVDEEALLKARTASYTAKDVEDVPPELLERYFEHVANRYNFRKDLRRSVIFGRHDIIQDAPISRIDLLICRNLLMYFNAETQSKVLTRLHFALKNGGYLFLGKAEMLLTHGNLFTPVDLRHRIFTKVNKVSLRDRLLVMAQNEPDEAGHEFANLMKVRDAVFERDLAAQIVVDPSGILIMANELARKLFGISNRDIGRPFRELEVYYRPLELRVPLEQAMASRTTVTIKDVELQNTYPGFHFLDLQVIPLLENQIGYLGTLIIFMDVTYHKNLQTQLENANQELETAMEELQSTNEELETTNEELQSTIEELETTNEELQSTNEEMETMNEELQSTNQELETVNDELQRRNQAYDQVNAFMEAILSSLDEGVVVLNQDMQVKSWNKQAQELWGMREDEVIDQHFLNLDIGLPVHQLAKMVRTVLNDDSGRQEMVVEATNRRGRQILCRVACVPLTYDRNKFPAVIILMEEAKEVNQEQEG